MKFQFLEERPEYAVTIDGNQEATQNDGLFLFENLGPGAYEIQINDLNGCLITETVYINSPEPIEIDPDIINPLCPGDNNGSSSPAVQWRGSTMTKLRGLEQVTDKIYRQAFTDFIVTDASGCTNIFTIPIIDPLPLSSEIFTSDVVCYGDNDGFIELSVSGGVPPYSYDWNGENPNALEQ